MKLAQVRKSIRLSSRLLERVSQAALISGRSQSSEIVALLESGLLSHHDSAELPQRDRRYDQLGLGSDTEVIVLTLSPDLVAGIDAMLSGDFAGKTFSDKTRYLISVGMCGLGRVIGIELSTLVGDVLGKNQIMTSEVPYSFLNIEAAADLVFISGQSDRVLVDVGAWMEAQNESDTIRVNYFDVGSQASVLGDSIIYWKRRTPYSVRHVLILNGVEFLSLAVLGHFITESMALNVQLVMLSARVGSLPARAKVKEISL